MLCELLGVMAAIATPESPLDPYPPQMSGDPAQLAKDAAASAERIVRAITALGMPGEDDQSSAGTLWNETIRQMERIQQLHKLPHLPFQDKALPAGQ